MRQQVLAWLAENVPDARVKHVLRVEQVAIELAQQHKLNIEHAAQAGLMHDLAKYFKPKTILQTVRAEGLLLDPADETNPHLLHAEASAIVARDRFRVRDEEVLQAISNHTLGRPNMSLLSCILFLADALEPGRGKTPELDALREKSCQDVYQAVWLTCDYKLKHLLKTQRFIHPRAIQTRNWFLNAVKERRKTIHNAELIQDSIPA